MDDRRDPDRKRRAGRRALKQQAFERVRGNAWERFATTLRRVQHGYRLDEETDPAEFARAYGEICRDLSLAKLRGYSHLLVERLNALVLGGHNVIYVRRSGYLAAFVDFFVSGFPRAVRDARGYMLVALIAFVGTGVGVGTAVAVEPDLIYSIMAPADVRDMETMYSPAAKALGRERESDSDFLMFGFYIYNNVSIAFQVFATGILAGLGTLFYLGFNGVVIGGVTAHLLSIGYSSTFLSFVVGHGAFELTAIVLSGGAGFVLADGVLAPGRRRRVDSVKQAAGRALPIVAGSAAMLLVAAFVEAFWSSSSNVPNVVKFVVGGVFWVLVLGYLTLAGRRGS